MISDYINQFSFNGKKSYSDMSLIITEPPTEVCPERDITYVSIPGRSGDLIQDNGRYKNTWRTYPIAAWSDDYPLEMILKKVSSWLAGSVGYHRLTDTYDPDYYRMATISGSIEFTQKLKQIGLASLYFNTKPFMYRIDGDNPIILTGSSEIYNPEDWESTPIIKLIGSGDITLNINGSSFSISNVEDHIELNSELMAAHKGSVLQNSKISFVDFPKLSPGKNDISFSGSVESIEIIPRWCTL